MFMLESGFDVEDVCWYTLLVLQYSWFNKSSKRNVVLEKFCSFCDQEYRKIIKHVSTGWLSLKTAAIRTLQLYQPLRSYFVFQEVRPNCLERLKVLFSDPITEVFHFFYQLSYKAFLILINTFREKNHYYQDYMTRFNNFSKELPVNFSKLILLQMEICSVMYGENKKIKNQATLIFDNISFSYFSTSYFFEN